MTRTLTWLAILLALVALSCAAMRGDEAWRRAIAHVAAADSARAIAQRATARAERRAVALARAATRDSARWHALHDSANANGGRIRRDSIHFADGVVEAVGQRTAAYIALLEREHAAAPIALNSMAISRGAERAVAATKSTELATADVQIATRDTAIAMAHGGRCGMKCGAVFGVATVILVRNLPRLLRAVVHLPLGAHGRLTH